MVGISLSPQHRAAVGNVFSAVGGFIILIIYYHNDTVEVAAFSQSWLDSGCFHVRILCSSAGSYVCDPCQQLYLTTNQFIFASAVISLKLQ